MNPTIDSWRRRTRLALAAVVFCAFALSVCQQCLNSAMAQPGPDPDPNNCKIGEDPET